EKTLEAKSAIPGVLAKTVAAAAWDDGEWWQRRVWGRRDLPISRGTYSTIGQKLDGGAKQRVLRSEIIGQFCRLRINLNVQKPLRRGIFVSTEIIPAEKNRIKEDPPFSLASKAELNLVGMESLKFNALSKKLQTQCSYIGDIKENQKAHLYSEKRSDTMQGVQEDSWKANWKRIEPMGVMRHHEAESKLQKRKLAEIIYDDYGIKETREDITKRMRYGGQDLINEAETNSIENPNQNRSAATKRQADLTQ
ncbi:hypothetical protein Godav_029537, partial [Gossypium davidsonii]|nr:hypothetical protein [Gossypium davidsonii]